MTEIPGVVRRSPWDIARVAAFDAGTEEVLVLERATVPGTSAAVREARLGEWRVRVTPARTHSAACTGLAELGIECEALADDIAGVAAGFLSQFGVTAASMRVEVVDTVSCPKFHCDNVRVRLVLTCHGPGTEYVAVDRPAEVAQAPTGALVFLKGHKHPTYADRTLHRSPAVPPGLKRMCVVLDI
jgi:hypothetical protein